MDQYPHRGSNHPLGDWGRVCYQLHQEFYILQVSNRASQGPGCNFSDSKMAQGKSLSLQEVEGLQFLPLLNVASGAGWGVWVPVGRYSLQDVEGLPPPPPPCMCWPITKRGCKGLSLIRKDGDRGSTRAAAVG